MIGTAAAALPSAGVSVITVTRNNAAGLLRTLTSLASLECAPREIIVIDAASTDNSLEVVEQFIGRMPIRHICERDGGIYDGMNKGRRLATCGLVHYLNAGDTVWGEPYRELTAPARLITNVADTDGEILFVDYVKLRGFGYCHQGVVLPRTHEPYNLRLRVAADLEMLVGTFDSGIATLPLCSTGGVTFFLGGVSSTKRVARDLEIVSVFWRRRGFYEAAMVAGSLLTKAAIPHRMRRILARYFSSRSNIES